MIFYYGHVACLYINKFRVAGLLDQVTNYGKLHSQSSTLDRSPLLLMNVLSRVILCGQGVDAYIEEIMETGVDEMSWDDLGKNDMEWPEVRRVTEYRRQVYAIVKNVILNGAWSFPIRIDDPAWAIVMGFEHERIHLETSSVLIRELPLHLVTRPDQFPPCHPSAFGPDPSRRVDNALVAVAGGAVELGKPRDWPSFGWDNEYGERRVQVRLPRVPWLRFPPPAAMRRLFASAASTELD